MKKLVFETIGLFLFFTVMVFIIGSFVGCENSNIEAKTQTGLELGYDRFQVIEGSYYDQAILIDCETGVEYL